MIPTLVIAIIAACAAILLCSIAVSQRFCPPERSLALSTPVVALWIIASAVWGPYFFSVKVPGLFDVTIERILFF